MNEIKLDPRKLLGFKIIASNATTMTLHSPKIGGKQCQSIDTSPVVAGPAGPACTRSDA
jgi:hypothetical protein